MEYGAIFLFIDRPHAFNSGRLVVLADVGNTPTSDMVCRHVFEWATHARVLICFC
jgi:hypothetical protein